MSISPCIQLFSVGPNEEDLVLSQDFRLAESSVCHYHMDKFFFLDFGFKIYAFSMVEIK